MMDVEDTVLSHLTFKSFAPNVHIQTEAKKEVIEHCKNEVTGIKFTPTSCTYQLTVVFLCAEYANNL